MLLKWLYLYVFGVIDVVIEGFFIEKLINQAHEKNIFLWNARMERETILRTRIRRSDFRKLCRIARKTGCKLHWEKKNGLNYVIKKYRKRKGFAIAFVVIAFFCFGVTRFIWNIEITGNDQISKEEILSKLAEYGIQEGKIKTNFDFERIKNEIRLSREDLAWIGIDIKGTNVMVQIVESKQEPKIMDPNTYSNIIADKDGIISKMVVRNGTARVNIGDSVSKGDLLVEGIMEGKYTGIREVNSDADIYVLHTYEKTRKEAYIQENSERTGEVEKNVEIYLKNFKIFFKKGVPKFEKCDTIREYKKVKLFSNYYLPIEMVHVTNFELAGGYKTYTQEELEKKITDKLEEELAEEMKNSTDAKIQTEVEKSADSSGVLIKVTKKVEEKIGTKE